jgi:mannose-6-phosphate isomerase-like protein (cupin superfamily)
MRGDMMFAVSPISTGTFFEFDGRPLSYVARGLRTGALKLEEERTHTGMVARGIVRVNDRHGYVDLTEGMYFCVPEGEMETRSADASALLISASFKGLRQFGGPIEDFGRLKYVSGCSDTLLLSPVRRGDPCLNHLHIPSHIFQERHYHPSDRIGIIFRGSGVCHTQNGDFELGAGMAWRITAGMDHSFESGIDGLDVVTWHPDSDYGPTDEDHPMINRTWIR